MKTRFFMFICISLMGCLLAGCDENVKKDPLEKYIYVNKSSLNMFYGDKMQLKANPAGESFEWTSADPAVATVTADGLVEAVGVGSTEITVSQGSSQTSLPVNVAIPTADKVIVAGENGRFQIAVQTLSERIASVRIIWNGNRDSIDISIDNRAGIFTRTVDYSGENGYVFQIVSFDRFGNKSVSSETAATQIRNRDVVSTTMEGDLLTVLWGNNVQYVDHCKLSYVNLNGQAVSRKVFPSETSTVIDDYSSNLDYTSLFTLIPSTVDTFRMETVSIAVLRKYLRTEWTAESRNGNHPWGAEGGEPFRMFDGNMSTGWHSRTGTEMPQCIVVDMKQLLPVHHIILYPHRSYRYMNNMEVYLSETPITPDADVPDVSWGTPAAVVQYTSGDSFTIEFPSVTTCQYIAVVFLTSRSSTYMNVMEFEAFGY
jgi:hypothetical protein